MLHPVSINPVPVMQHPTQSRIEFQKKARLLVVDDEKPMRQLIQLALGKAGYAVCLASCGQEALNAVQGGDVDLVVLDLMLPDISGYTVCAQIRAGSNLPIILASALNQPDEVVRGFEAGADDFITKPFQPRELVTRVETLLRRVAWQQEQQQVASNGRLVPTPWLSLAQAD